MVKYYHTILKRKTAETHGSYVKYEFIQPVKGGLRIEPKQSGSVAYVLNHCLLLPIDERLCLSTHDGENTGTIVFFQILWSTNEAECKGQGPEGQGSGITALHSCVM